MSRLPGGPRFQLDVTGCVASRSPPVHLKYVHSPNVPLQSRQVNQEVSQPGAAAWTIYSFSWAYRLNR